MLSLNDDNVLQLRHRTHIFPPDTQSFVSLCVRFIFYGASCFVINKMSEKSSYHNKAEIKYSRKQTPVEISKALTRQNSHLCAHG